MRTALLAVALCACRSPAPAVDCAAIRADPGRALERLSAGSRPPEAVWSDIERCFSPPGADDCQRALTGLLAVPSMATSDGHGPPPGYEEAYLAACRSLPPARQRCLTISYAIGHAAECEGARAALDEALRRP
jgi:hypothetical protein